MPESTITFRVDDDLKAVFAEKAKKRDRTVAQLLRDFMRDYVKEDKQEADYDAWFRKKVELGLKDIQEGRVVSHEQVKADAAARRAMLLERLGSGPV